MVNTAPNIIHLITVLSGIHAHFTNHTDAKDVTVNMVSGNNLLGEGIKITSDKCPYTIDISTAEGANGALDISIWEDGTMVQRVQSTAAAPEERRTVKLHLIAVLKGEAVYD